MSELRRTPLYQNHKDLGGKIVPFAGWELPVLYSSVVEEHKAVREKAGLFDVSHMGEIFVEGTEAEKALQYLTCNDVSKLVDGQAQYGAIINEKGGVVDDIIIYRYNSEKFLICVNASNADKDFAWFQDKNTFNCEFTNRSDDFGQIALQGPKAESIAAKLSPSFDVSELKYFHFTEGTLAGVPVILARTGYTGEDGFEFFVQADKTPELWNAVLEAGQGEGLIPAGLGARDSLRLEACYPLHGHELGDDISAIESGIGWTVKLDKGDFLGSDVLKDHKENGPPRRLKGFFLVDKGIVREESPIFSEDGQEIGVCTSGTKTPTIGKALGLALLNKGYTKLGTKIFAEVRGRKIQCEVVKTPFYKRT